MTSKEFNNTDSFSFSIPKGNKKGRLPRKLKKKIKNKGWTLLKIKYDGSSDLNNLTIHIGRH